MILKRRIGRPRNYNKPANRSAIRVREEAKRLIESLDERSGKPLGDKLLSLLLEVQELRKQRKESAITNEHIESEMKKYEKIQHYLIDQLNKIMKIDDLLRVMKDIETIQ